MIYKPRARHAVPNLNFKETCRLLTRKPYLEMKKGNRPEAGFPFIFKSYALAFYKIAYRLYLELNAKFFPDRFTILDFRGFQMRIGSNQKVDQGQNAQYNDDGIR